MWQSSPPFLEIGKVFNSIDVSRLAHVLHRQYTTCVNINMKPILNIQLYSQAYISKQVLTQSFPIS